MPLTLNNAGKMITPSDRQGSFVLSADQSTAADDVLRIQYNSEFYDRVVDGPLRANHLKLYPDGSDQTAKFTTALGKAVVKHVVFDTPGTNTYVINGTLTIPNTVTIEVSANTKFTGSGTINGGIWKLEDGQVLVAGNLTFNPYAFAKGHVQPHAWGLLPDTGADVTPLLQKAVFWAAKSTTNHKVYIALPGTYVINDLVVMKDAGSSNSGQVSINLEGSSYSDTGGVTFYTNNPQAATIHIQQAKGMNIKNIFFKGANPSYIQNPITEDWTFGGAVRTNPRTPHCAVAIDDIYTNSSTSTLSPSDYYPGVPVSYYNNTHYGGCSGVLMENCSFTDYQVVIANGLSGCPNGENIVVRQSYANNYRVFWAAGQLQSRENVIDQIFTFNFETFVTNVGWGDGRGDLPTVINCNINNGKYLFQAQADFTFPRFLNGYSEGMWSLGKSTSNNPVSFTNWNYTQLDDNLYGGLPTPSAPLFVECSTLHWTGGKMEGTQYKGQWPMKVNNAKFSSVFIRGSVPYCTNFELFDRVEFENCMFTGYGGTQGLALSDNIHLGSSADLDESTLGHRYITKGSTFKTRSNRTYKAIGQKFDRIQLGGATITVDTATNTASFTPDDMGKYTVSDHLVVAQDVDNPNDVYSASPTSLGFVSAITGGKVIVSHIPAGITSGTYNLSIIRLPWFIGRFIGDLTSGSNVVANLTFDNGSMPLSVGDHIKGIGLPAGCRIASVNLGTSSMTLSMNATATTARVHLYDLKTQVTSNKDPFNYFGITDPFNLESLWIVGDVIENTAGGQPTRWTVTQSGRSYSAITPTFSADATVSGTNAFTGIQRVVGSGSTSNPAAVEALIQLERPGAGSVYGQYGQIKLGTYSNHDGSDGPGYQPKTRMVLSVLEDNGSGLIDTLSLDANGNVSILKDVRSGGNVFAETGSVIAINLFARGFLATPRIQPDGNGSNLYLVSNAVDTANGSNMSMFSNDAPSNGGSIYMDYGSYSQNANPVSSFNVRLNSNGGTTDKLIINGSGTKIGDLVGSGTRQVMVNAAGILSAVAPASGSGFTYATSTLSPTSGTVTIGANEETVDFKLTPAANMTINIGTTSGGSEIASNVVLAANTNTIIQYASFAETSTIIYFSNISGGNLQVRVKKLI